MSYDTDWQTTAMIPAGPGWRAIYLDTVDGVPELGTLPIVAWLHQTERRCTRSGELDPLDSTEDIRVIAGTCDFDGTVDPVDIADNHWCVRGPDEPDPPVESVVAGLNARYERRRAFEARLARNKANAS